MSRLYLDTNIIIYHLESVPEWGAQASALMRASSSQRISGVVGEAVIAEVMVGAFRSPVPQVPQKTLDFFRSGALDVRPHDQDAFLRAARIRGETGAGLIDALHLATALAAGCDAIVSHDSAMPHLPQMPVLRLDQLDLGQ